MNYTNNTGIPLSLAVLLATDNYDYIKDVNTLSVTALMKPIKPLVLSLRAKTQGLTDISDRIPSVLGTAIHTALEVAWKDNYEDAMLALGYPQRIINNVKINPSNKELTEDTLPVYLEIRSNKQVLDWTISGKFDLVLEGRVNDLKNTGTYTYIHKTKEEDYILQGSIYRWLNQDIITEDDMSILYIFSDWSKLGLAKDPINYPKSKLLEVKYPLLSLTNTERYIKDKLLLINKLIDKPEKDLPICTKEDLWMGESIFKYYKDSNKLARSTKNFKSFFEANERFIKDGSIGIILEKKGLAKACGYCPANNNCNQYKELEKQGLIT